MTPSHLVFDEHEGPLREPGHGPVELASDGLDGDVAAEEEKNNDSLSGDPPALEELLEKLRELVEVQRGDINLFCPCSDNVPLVGAAELVRQLLQGSARGTP